MWERGSSLLAPRRRRRRLHAHAAGARPAAVVASIALVEVFLVGGVAGVVVAPSPSPAWSSRPVQAADAAVHVAGAGAGRRGLWLQTKAGRDRGSQSGGPRPAGFFEDEAQEMYQGDGAGASVNAGGSCHPKCTWSCDKPECNTRCKPVCKPPKCVTTCEKPKVSQCRHFCEDPKCAVVCPSGPCDGGGACPDCQTVCGQPNCRLDCGQGRLCRSTCADPECAWKCEPGFCPQPTCNMRCETPQCAALKEKEPTLREVYAGHGPNALNTHSVNAVRYLGREVAWQGLANVPSDQLMPGALGANGAVPATGAIPATGAGMMDGAKPRTGEACMSFCKQNAPSPAPSPLSGPAAPVGDPFANPPCDCGIEAEGKVGQLVDWVIVAKTPSFE